MPVVVLGWFQFPCSTVCYDLGVFFWLFVAMWFFHPCLREHVPFLCLYLYIYSVTSWFSSFISFIYIFLTFDIKKELSVSSCWFCSLVSFIAELLVSAFACDLCVWSLFLSTASSSGSSWLVRLLGLGACLFLVAGFAS
jgi:hypothetical protein